MNLKINSRHFIKTSLCLALTLGFAAWSSADDKKADPAGTWTWSSQRNGSEMKSTLTLKNEGDKLTGKLVTKLGDDQKIESDVEEGKVKGDEVSFKVNPEFNGNKFSIKFSGKLDGDTIKGNLEFER